MTRVPRVPVRARMPAEKKFAMKGKKLLKRRGVVHHGEIVVATDEHVDRDDGGSDAG